jgi:hypothetical protein
VRFIETPTFTRVMTQMIDDDSYRELQSSLMVQPEKGPLIRGAHGARKLRWQKAGGGKRGGIRVIYFWSLTEEAFYMLYAYAKSRQGDLTPAQTKLLGDLIREEFK